MGRPAAQREALLSVLRLHEPLVAAEVASLLESHDRPGDFLPSLPVDDEPPDLAGRSVGAYRLLTLLGTGGAGAVYLAERSDGSFAKRVAVKLLSSGFVPLRDRFLRERDFLAGLEHPNIARLLDAGTTDDHLLYLVMEYVEGLPIDNIARSAGSASPIASRCCSGVRGSGLRASAPDHPLRHQAGERPGHEGRPGEAARFRHRPPDEPARDHHASSPGHAGLFEP